MDTALRGSGGCQGCGRDWDILTRIEGRKHEWLVTHTGRHISMSSINMHDRVFDPILRFQFYQDSPGRLTFRYIPRTSLLAAEERFIRRSLAVKLGDDVELTLEPVAEIARTGAGKFQILDQRLEVALVAPVELRS
jgi:phenylacetate-CoA ligase